jgi:hypothetical protein
MNATRPALPMSGGCPCGAIRYRIGSFPLLLYTCHCTDCQRGSGSAFALNMPVLARDFRILQGEPKGWRHTSPSGVPVVSWFCGDCGGRIYGERAGRPDSINLRAGTPTIQSGCFRSHICSWQARSRGLCPRPMSNATRPAPTISGRWRRSGARCGPNSSRKNSSIFTEPYDVRQV